MILKNAKILVIDDDTDVLTAVKLLLKTEAKEVFTEKNPELIQSMMSMHRFDIVLLDMNFKSSINTGNEGIFWLKKIKELDENIIVIMITAYGDIDLAVRSLKEGASDFIVKPWHNEKLLEAIKGILKTRDKVISGTPSNNTSPLGKEIIGESEAIKDIFFKIEKIAPTDANIFILGENGTGKDLIAKAIHENSLRADKPFVKVYVGSLTETLFESELFGHKKGAFTGANEDRIGRFEQASGGTLFLDEIGNLTMPLQAKLLTAIQNKKVSRVGANKETLIDLRLICATNLPLYEMVKENRFRQDLLYRINTIEIEIPPLRDRIEDIPLLANHFLKHYSTRYGKNITKISEGAMTRMTKHPWPGNIRELQHSLERAIILSNSSVLQPEDFNFATPITKEGDQQINLDQFNLEEVEKLLIRKVLKKYNGNITQAAAELGLTRSSLYRRLEKHGL